MKTSKEIEVKVGLFVFICLGILALLLIQFTKGSSLFSSGYEIILNTSNVGGLRAQSGVLMSGVRVGTVSRAVLSKEGTNVAIHLNIQKGQIIYDDSLFRIEQSGFLGDQFVSIYPGKGHSHHPGEHLPLLPGAEVAAKEPFNMEEVAAKAGDLIEDVQRTVGKLSNTIDAIRDKTLNDQTLTNLAESLQNVKAFTSNALDTVDELKTLIHTNSAAATFAVSNIVDFSSQLKTMGNRAQALLEANTPVISSTITNFQYSSTQLTNLLADVQSGKGLAGALIENGALKDNISTLASNLAVTTGNLNRMGVWHWLFFKPKSADTNTMAGGSAGRK